MAVPNDCRAMKLRLDFTAQPLECGDLSPLLAGDLSPSTVVRRTILGREIRAGGFSRRAARRCLAHKSAKRKKRRQVAALQSAGSFSGGFKQALAGGSFP